MFVGSGLGAKSESATEPTRRAECLSTNCLSYRPIPKWWLTRSARPILSGRPQYPDIQTLISNPLTYETVFAPMYADLLYTDFCQGTQLEKPKAYVVQNIASVANSTALAVLDSYVGVPLFDDLLALGLPVLVAYGSRDKLSSPHAAGFLQYQISQSDIAEFLGRGASPEVTSYGRFQSVLLAFLHGLEICDECQVCPWSSPTKSVIVRAAHIPPPARLLPIVPTLVLGPVPTLVLDPVLGPVRALARCIRSRPRPK